MGRHSVPYPNANDDAQIGCLKKYKAKSISTRISKQDQAIYCFRKVERAFTSYQELAVKIRHLGGWWDGAATLSGKPPPVVISNIRFSHAPRVPGGGNTNTWIHLSIIVQGLFFYDPMNAKLGDGVSGRQQMVRALGPVKVAHEARVHSALFSATSWAKLKSQRAIIPQRALQMVVGIPNFFKFKCVALV